MADLKCSGSEWSVDECAWSAPDAACQGHAQDTIVFCSQTGEATTAQGTVRLLAGDGSPSIDGKGRPEIFMEGAWVPICSSGVSAGAAGVICKSMGFSGTSSSSKCNGGGCGNAAPGVSELSCTGAESEPLACPHQAGDDVFCAASESLVVACTGDGETQGWAIENATCWKLLCELRWGSRGGSEWSVDECSWTLLKRWPLLHHHWAWTCRRFVNL